MNDLNSDLVEDNQEIPTTMRPKKPLPAKKLSTAKQFDCLRSIAVASTEERKPITIQQVADILNMHPNTVSICNPFFDDIGLIEKQGHKFVPSAEVIEFNKKYQWTQEEAGHKLAPIIKNTWFASPLLQRLAIRSMGKDEVISLFAEECSASPEYKGQLVMLLDYMIFSGLVIEENGTINLRRSKESPQTPAVVNTGGGTMTEVKPHHDANKYESFEIPIPGKDSAIIRVPKGLEGDDWEMLKTMIDAYISRLKKTQSGA